jgi:hypothetical protein
MTGPRASLRSHNGQSMPVTVRLIRRPFGFVPATKADADNLVQFPMHAPLTATLSRGKSRKMFRFYWGLIGHVAEAIGDDKEVLSDELKKETRRIELYDLKNGMTRIKTKSLAAMDHTEFKSYLDDAIGIIIQRYLPHMNRLQLLREVERMLGLTYDEAFKQASITRKLAA